MSDNPALAKASGKAYQSCLRLLAFRNRSTVEISIYLERKGYPEGLAQEVVSRLQKEGLLDDRAFAVRHVESRLESSPRSQYALGYELRQKGIGEAIIQEVTADLDDYRSALAAIKLRQHQWRHLGPEQVQKKILGLLRTRGFSHGVAMTTLKTVIADIDPADERRD